MAAILRWMVLLAGLAGPALAQPSASPACGPATRGQVACMAQRLCSCGYVQGGSLTGVPSGWAWDCGILRPDCRPAPAPSYGQPMPDVFVTPTWPPGARPDPRWPGQPWGHDFPMRPDAWSPNAWSPNPWSPDLWSPDPSGFERRPFDRPITPPLPGPAPLTPRPPRP